VEWDEVFSDTVEAKPWAAEWDWVQARLKEKEFGQVAKWLNGQSKRVFETYFLRRMKSKTVARLHWAATKHPEVGPNSQFARETKGRYLRYRFLRAVVKRKWKRAAKWLDRLGSSRIRFLLARLPLSFVPKLRAGALAHPKVGPGSTLARILTRSEPHPAFFPPRSSGATVGSQLLGGWRQTGRPSDWVRREQAIIDELIAGNMPGWLRRWIPIPVSHTAGGRTISGTVYVLPDYLAVGSDTDYVHVPLDKHSAQRVASKLGAILPTARICHAIYVSLNGSSNQELTALPRAYWKHPRTFPPPSWLQVSSAAYLEHSQAIQKQIKDRGIARGTLVAGHKKDVVIAQRLHGSPQHVAFQGFYDSQGFPHEPCYENSTHRPQANCKRDVATLAHPQANGRFADYSQGVRLVHRWMLVEGKRKSVRKVLASATLAPLISAEGTIIPARIRRT